MSEKSRIQRIFDSPEGGDLAPWRTKLYEIIFEAETTAGKALDYGLLALIGLSIVAVSLETVQHIEAEWGPHIRVTEWVITALFTIEYVIRLIVVRRPLGYALSFFGIVDLVSIIPSYLALFVDGANALAIIRVLRVLRLFRLFGLSQFVHEAEALTSALASGMRKIVVFLTVVATIVTIMGAVLYLVEGEESGFTSIPKSIYWAIVTLTTVGYGDIAPQSAFGQFLAGIIMIMGYAIIAVPTGLVSAELVIGKQKQISTKACPDCTRNGHDPDAIHCKYCGADL